MVSSFKPTSAPDLGEVIAAAAAAGRSLEVLGGGARRGFGRPLAADAILDLGAFCGVRVYEPEELVLTCGPATPMAEIEALLAANNQQLAFEPPDLGGLWGLPKGRGTLGGALSIGLGGPRRVTAGAPRDHFLGFKAVNGGGDLFAAGGRVVKNVTGYDLPKLMAGAFGTLGAMTEVTVKVLPRAEAIRTIAFMGLTEPAGLRVLIAAMNGPYQVTAAAHLPGGLTDDARSATLLRLESIPATVAAATEELLALFRFERGEVRLLEAEASGPLWKAIGGAEIFAGSAAPVWRLSVPPASAAAIGEGLRQAGIGRHYYDWGGGALWVEDSIGMGGAGEAIRRLIRTLAGHGHATLIRAEESLRAEEDAFEPMAPALAALTRRVKARFDPFGVLNAGRMYRDF